MTQPNDPMDDLTKLAGLESAPAAITGRQGVVERHQITAMDPVAPDALLPGDVIFAKGRAPISRVVSFLNGYWSHSALFCGGADRSVVHASLPGVISEPIDSFIGHYPRGQVAFARPTCEAPRRHDAVEWALARAERESESDAADPYSGRDLGLAAALLLRATVGDLLGWVERGDDEIREITDELTSVQLIERDRTWTCAGLVWDAYMTGADRPIRPSFLEIMRVDEERLVVRGKPHDDELHERALSLLSVRGVDATSLIGDDARAKLRSWGQLVDIVSAAVPELRHATDPRVGMQVVTAVGPNDLWHSPDLSERTFLEPTALA